MTRREKICFLLGINYAARCMRNSGHVELAEALIVEQVSIDPEDLACSATRAQAPEETRGIQREIIVEFKLNSTEMNNGERGQ